MKRRIIAVYMLIALLVPVLPIAVSMANSSSAVEGIELNIDEITIGVGQKVKTVTPIALPEGTSSKFTWKSADEKIAKVNSKGKITGVKKGDTTITITADNGVATELKVNVVKKGKGVTAIKLNKTKATVTRGKSLTLKATLTPKSPKNKNIIWVSSNEEVATVSSKGKVKAVSVGTATISAISSSGKTATCKVTVDGVKVKKIKLKGKKEILRNEPMQLNAEITPKDADNQELKWKSSNKKIATVDKNGVVTGVKKGTVTITATAKDGSGVKATFKVTVKKGVFTPTPTPVPTATPTPVPTATPAPTATAEPAPTATAEPAPTATAEPAPTGTSVPAPTATVEPAPTATTEPVVTVTPAPDATATPVPAETPTPEVPVTPTSEPGTTPAPEVPADVVYEIKVNEITGTEGVVIIRYEGADVKVTIPDTIAGLPVIEIADEAFMNNTTMEEINLPDTIVIIGKRAFAGCTSLKKMN